MLEFKDSCLIQYYCLHAKLHILLSNGGANQAETPLLYSQKVGFDPAKSEWSGESEPRRRFVHHDVFEAVISAAPSEHLSFSRHTSQPCRSKNQSKLRARLVMQNQQRIVFVIIHLASTLSHVLLFPFFQVRRLHGCVVSFG